jgi:hypothetical protein
MKMNFQDLLESMSKALTAMADSFIVKAIFSSAVAFLASPQGTAAQAFFVLIFIDLLTRWTAICYVKMQREGRTGDDLGLYCCLMEIPNAMKSGDINSDSMKHRFMGKIIVYTMFTLVAIHTDNMLQAAGEVPLLLKLSWVYLATTESMSILENLRDAGVEQAGTLLEVVRSKATSLLDKYKK